MHSQAVVGNTGGKIRGESNVHFKTPLFTIEQLNYLVDICEHDEHRFDCPVCGQEIWRRAIETERARERQAVTQFGSVPENFPAPNTKGETRDIVAQTIGLGSGKHTTGEKMIGTIKDIEAKQDAKS